MPIRGLDHIDLAVSDVDRSLAFYLGMLGPVGLSVEARFESYRGTEEIVYLGFGLTHVQGTQPETRLGLRKADGGEHRHYEVGIEHLAFTVDSRSEVDDAYQRCLEMGAHVLNPPEEEWDLPGYYAFFVRDPDGIRVEVDHWTDELRREWDKGKHREVTQHRAESSPSS
jgi:catechol 2,3-dioxygenase-like lactoylglutathione lyase family enzyme